MKNLYLLLLITILFSKVASAQAHQGSDIDSSTVLKLENDWAIALVNRDTTIFDKVLAPDFFYTENEKMYSRREVIQSAISPAERIESAYNEDMQIHLKDKTAIVTGWLVINGKGDAGEFKRRYRFTDIWFKKDKWQLIAAQDYLLP